MPARKASDATDAPAEEFSFEEALARLEEIVEELESGQMSLEDALTRFEEGTRLQRVCLQRLQRAETRIEQVLAENAAETDSAEGDSGEEAE